MRLPVLTLLLAAPLAALAQTKPAPAKVPVTLDAGRMGPLAHGGDTNRPDHAPEYPGGAEAMGEFFAQHVQVPVKAKQARVTGNVIVTATVGADGKLANPKIAQGLTPECNAEALRVVQTLPAWQPATRAACRCPCWCRCPCHSTTRASPPSSRTTACPAPPKTRPACNAKLSLGGWPAPNQRQCPTRQRPALRYFRPCYVSSEVRRPAAGQSIVWPEVE